MSLTPLQTRTEYVLEAESAPGYWGEVGLYKWLGEALEGRDRWSNRGSNVRILQRVIEESVVED